MKVPSRKPDSEQCGRALAYAALGYFVFPLQVGTKSKQVPGAWPESSRDPDQILRWWTAHPDANIGIACKPSGIAVLDPDAPHQVTNTRTGEVSLSADGKATWLALAREHGWPEHADVTTPRGGSHVYYRDPHGLGNSTGGLPAGIDVRAGGGQYGGYVLAPGSVVDGRTYVGDLPAVADLPEVPLSLVELLQAEVRERQTSEPLGSTGQAVALIRECNAVRVAPEGTRNSRLNEAAFSLGQLVGPGSELSEGLVRASLREVARDAGLDLDETEATIRSGLSKGMDRARPVATVETEREAKVVERLDWLRIQNEAKRRFDEENRPVSAERGGLTDGAAFVFDVPTETPAIWGFGRSILWAAGEACIIAGPAGVGKTTLTGQLVRARLGLGDGLVLGQPVKPTTSKVLYLAMDRPQQIRRSLNRHFDSSEREVVRERLVVWKGPPPYDLAARPETLAELAAEAGADTVIVDSLKDAALGLSADEVGAAYNRARQHAIAAGVEVLELHHQTKSGEGGTRPDGLKNVYGSTWITAGAGSVWLLWGEAGDQVVEMIHLKPNGDLLGPWKVRHDHAAGVSRIESHDPLALLASVASPGWVNVSQFTNLWGDDPKDRAARERNRRRLARLVTNGQAERTEQGPPTKPVEVFRALTVERQEGLL